MKSLTIPDFVSSIFGFRGRLFDGYIHERQGVMTIPDGATSGMSETPRTDGEEGKVFEDDGSISRTGWVSTAFARTLETELSAMRGELAAVATAIGSTHFMDPPDGGTPSLAEQVSRLRGELAESVAVSRHWQAEALGADVHRRQFDALQKELAEARAYRADFAWPHSEGSIEEAAYEFANAKTEDYRKQWFDTLRARIESEKERDLSALRRAVGDLLDVSVFIPDGKEFSEWINAKREVERLLTKTPTPAQEQVCVEPVMVRCPKADTCGNAKWCLYTEPHKKDEHCDSNGDDGTCPKCVPVVCEWVQVMPGVWSGHAGVSGSNVKPEGVCTYCGLPVRVKGGGE